jgi:hypothetical protein
MEVKDHDRKIFIQELQVKKANLLNPTMELRMNN